jgi:hypothetical protein
MSNNSLRVQQDCILAQSLDLSLVLGDALSDEERAMMEAGFEAIRIPLEKIATAHAGGNNTARVDVAERRVTFSDIMQVDIVLLELNGNVEQISANVGNREFFAPVPYMPATVRNLFTAARTIMPGKNSYMLFLPEWQPAPRDPIALYGDLSNGYLWKIGQWNGFEEAKKIDDLLRKRSQ